MTQTPQEQLPEQMDVRDNQSSPRPPRALRAKTADRHRPYLIVISLVVVVSGLVFLMADSSGFEFYKHVDEVSKEPAAWKDRRLQLHGFVTPKTITATFDRNIQRKEYRFQVENCGAVMDAYFAGIVPDTFKDGAEVVLKGHLTINKTAVPGANPYLFMTEEVMAKCPSKYAQAGEQQSQMVTRCARDKTDKKEKQAP